jgi:transposase
MRGKIALIRRIAAFRPGALTSTTASAKTALRTLAQRWLSLQEEIQSHDKALEQLVADRAPTLLTSHGIATITAAEMLILVGDDPTQIRSEAALAKLCGVCPIPASSGKTNRRLTNIGASMPWSKQCSRPSSPS